MKVTVVPVALWTLLLFAVIVSLFDPSFSFVIHCTPVYTVHFLYEDILLKVTLS